MNPVQSISKQLAVMCAKSSCNAEGEIFLPFWVHSLDCAEITSKLIYRWLPESVIKATGLTFETFSKVCCFLGLVHDIGKLTPAFQSRILIKLPELREKAESCGVELSGFAEFHMAGRSSHPVAGEAILLSRNCPAGIASIVGAHHGRSAAFEDFPEENINHYDKNYHDKNPKLWESLWDEWIRVAVEYSQIGSLKNLPIIDQASQFLLSGILIVGDWIASNTDYFPLVTSMEQAQELSYPDRVQIAWERLGFPNRWESEFGSMTVEDFQNQFGFLPNTVQKAAIEIAKPGAGLMIIEAQMGCGKTEAALSSAEIIADRDGSGGVFFGLPSQATANGIFPRVRDWAEQLDFYNAHTMELLHGSAALNAEFNQLQKYHQLDENVTAVAQDMDQSGIYLNDWFSQRKTGLLADFSVGTVDQFLMAALKRKHVMLRMLGLVGKVIIIDECHAYDAYMNVYLDQVLTWLGTYGTPVILLSATLPPERRKELVAAYLSGKVRKTEAKKKAEQLTETGYPLITWIKGDQAFQRRIQVESKRQEVQLHAIKEQDLTVVLRQKLSGGGCAGVIVNTVRKAQEIYCDLTKAFPDHEVILLHSSFMMDDRAKIESCLLQRIGKASQPEQRNGFIVVGTQVLEQSLDIDFDIMVTQLCPIDLLFQRIGRLHRHRRTRPQALADAECLILEPDQERINNQAQNGKKEIDAALEQATDYGTRQIYGEWLLIKTLEVLQYPVYRNLHIPQDIPELVSSVYQIPDSKQQLDEMHRQIWDGYKKQIAISRSRARVYCIPTPRRLNLQHPESSTLDGMLDKPLERDDNEASAAVRDTGASIEVFLIFVHSDQGLAAVKPGSTQVMPLDTIPDLSFISQIIRNRLKLPRIFCLRWNETIQELNGFNERYFHQWKASKLLQDALFLPLDDMGEGRLLEFHIRYDAKKGFQYWKENTEEGDEFS